MAFTKWGTYLIKSRGRILTRHMLGSDVSEIRRVSGSDVHN